MRNYPPPHSLQNIIQNTLNTNIPLPTGTTYSCVATYEGTNVEIIANEQGSFTTPSFVSFTDKERLIGEAAKNNAAMNPRNTVFDAK
jgi:L1 cell adhesion molecule like protein